VLYAVSYAQKGPARFLSHLEVVRVFERAFRRASLPLKLSQGFNPRPYLWFALPLPVGTAGRSEYLVVELAEPFGPEAVLGRLAPELPEGFALKAVRSVAPGADLSRLAEAAAYRVRPGWRPEPRPEEVRQAAKELMGRPSFSVTVKDKPKDIRPGILVLRARPRASRLVLVMLLSTEPGRYVRPEAVLHALAELGGWKAEEPPWVERLGLFTCRGPRLLPLGVALASRGAEGGG
jgi:radical SAM-linked protein